MRPKTLTISSAARDGKDVDGANMGLQPILMDIIVNSGDVTGWPTIDDGLIGNHSQLGS